MAEEAGALSALFEDVGGFPVGARERVREAIVAYDRSVLTDDFHAVERTGEPSVRTTRRLSQLYDAVRGAEPEVGTSAFFSQAVTDLSDSRRRGGPATPTPPTRSPDRCSAAIVTALNLALIVALEHPFSGAISVSDQPLRVGALAPAAR